jgi:N-acetylmuramoyl-L-alanine amidase
VQRRILKEFKRLVVVIAVMAMMITVMPHEALAATIHTVKRGDTLWKISQWYGTTVYELKRANNHWNDAIYPGQKLTITWPAAASRGASTYTAGPSANDTELMAKMVYAESRGEPFEGQVAVASVILNRVKDGRFPNTVSGVIYQPGAFTPVQNGQLYQAPNATAYKAVDNALKGWDASGGAIYFFNPNTATSSWIWSRQIVKKIGKHYFAK